MFLAYMYYRYHERMGNFFRRKRAQYINKFKRRWINKYNPDAVTYQTALDAAYYRPAHMGSEEAEKIGEAFVKVDRDLSNGFSR